MQETLKSFWKTKVALQDYDYVSDIKSRILLHSLSSEEVAILEEILYSPLKVSLEELSESVDIPFENIYPIIEKLQETQLFSFDGSDLVINKEKRKYFEVHIQKFEEDFTPNMEFLQGLLKQIPIHILPLWYHIPRSSNNIFESLLEKYLLTPQIYQRYLVEFMSQEELPQAIAKDLFDSEDFELSTAFLKEKYHLNDYELEEAVIFLEYNLIGAFCYKKKGSGFEPVLTLFNEWREHLLFLKKAKPLSIQNVQSIVPFRPHEYAFIEDMSSILILSKTYPVLVKYDSAFERWTVMAPALPEIKGMLGVSEETYIHKLAEKILVLGLGVIEETQLEATDAAYEWLEMPIEKRSHVTFKHPHNFLAMQKTSPIATQRAVVEIQKSLSSIADLGWVTFANYFANTMIILSDDKKVTLHKIGRSWQYTLPTYTPEEMLLIRSTLFDWLFESGILQKGTYLDEECFSLTALGKSLLT